MAAQRVARTGNDDDAAATNAVAGRGRFAAAFATSVTSAVKLDGEEQEHARSATDAAATASTIATRAITSEPSGPNTVQSTCQKVTHAG